MSELSKYQKFEAITVHRSELKNAPYNPRIMDEKSRSKLKKLLKKNGLVETLVWNKRTGNIVGGHQRIDILDQLENSIDYSLTVACVDLDLKKEKELNISLNNPTLSGEYDFDSLRAIGDIDWGNTGFEMSEVSYFKTDEVITSMEKDLNPAEVALAGELNGIKDQNYEAKKERVKNMKEEQRQQKEETGEKFFVVTFHTRSQRDQFLEKYGFATNEKYVDGYSLETIIKMK